MNVKVCDVDFNQYFLILVISEILTGVSLLTFPLSLFSVTVNFSLIVLVFLDLLSCMLSSEILTYFLFLFCFEIINVELQIRFKA